MSDRPDRGYRVFEWVNRRIGFVAIAVVVLALALGMLGPIVANEEEANFSPTGELYTIEQRVEDVFDPETSIVAATFLVEDPDQFDVLTQEALLTWQRRADLLRADTSEVQGRPLNARLVTGVDLDLGIEIDRIFSIADVVDAQLPNGLAGATDADVKLVLAALLDDEAPTASLRGTLGNPTSELTEIRGEPTPIWRAPAFAAQLRYDWDSFAGVDLEKALNAEAWLVEAQTVLRGGQRSLPGNAALNVWGVAIDFNTAFEDSFQEGGPYVFLAVALIVMLVGALLRSYWAAAVVALGLGVTMLSYNGVVGLIQLDTSPLLQLIVPIAMISFGVDFFIHGAGRTREAQVQGHSRERAYPMGMTAVFTALILAAATSAAAFLSNAAGGIEAITEFGIGAAIALALAYVFLGLIAPRVLLGIENRLRGRPSDLGPVRETPYKVLFFIAAIVAGVMVAMTVVFPSVGAPLFLIYLALFMYVPYLWSRRRNRRAVERGHALADEVRGAGHGFAAAGALVHFLARWRVITVPAVVILAIVGVVTALQVKSEFQITDFLPSNSDTVVSFEKSDDYFRGDVGGPGYVYVEGDLTAPDALVALDAAATRLRGSPAPDSDVEFAAGFDGQIVISENAASLARAAVASPVAIEDIAATTGVTVTDSDGNGLPDDAAQVAAVYQHAYNDGIRNADGDLILRPDIVQRFLYVERDTQATRIQAIIPTFTEYAVIDADLAVLNAIAEDLRAALGDRADTIGVSGPPITNKDTLDAFVQSMLISLPVAIVLATLIAALVMRSIKYALVSIVPILLVVAWVYGYMYMTDLTINPVTATIAAIAIGVGIDFATHFTVRFREEFVGEPSRFPAIRRAGTGTGGALSLSALTSIVGFWALSLAPTPIFAMFGQLTAVMVFFALAVSLLVLPSLLLLVTPSRKGPERERLEVEITKGEYAYDPHAPATAERRQE